MASPGLETFCCMQNLTHYYFDDITPNSKQSEYFNFQKTSYNAICITTSSCSIIGALFLMIPWSSIRRRLAGAEGIHILPHQSLKNNQKKIMFWLSVADLMACLGILTRSSVWIAHQYPLTQVPDSDTVDFAHVFCAISTAWIQYFFTCTYMWTFLYALDVVFRVTYRASHSKVYHFIGWIVPLVLTIGGLVPVYTPNILQCYYSLPKVLPGYLAGVLPMYFVMIVNPALYIYASAAVKNVVTCSQGRYTDAERFLVLRIREKYFLIILVFYACWLPNVINSILLMFRHKVSLDIFIAVWNAMAVSNSLQAFLNVLAYKTFSQANLGRARITANYMGRACLRALHLDQNQSQAYIQSQSLGL